MTGFLRLASALVVAAALTQAVPAQASTRGAKPAATPAAHESPFACNRVGLTPTERKRHFEELGPRLRALRKGMRELDNGYEFEFPSDRATFALLSEWMIQERACCPFFELSLRLEREGGPMWLRLSGREGVKEFIRGEFPAEWFRPHRD